MCGNGVELDSLTKSNTEAKKLYYAVYLTCQETDNITTSSFNNRFEYYKDPSFICQYNINTGAYFYLLGGNLKDGCYIDNMRIFGLKEMENQPPIEFKSILRFEQLTLADDNVIKKVLEFFLVRLKINENLRYEETNEFSLESALEKLKPIFKSLTNSSVSYIYDIYYVDIYIEFSKDRIVICRKSSAKKWDEYLRSTISISRVNENLYLISKY
jgi:hypothetical protein